MAVVRWPFNSRLESEFSHEGIPVKIANSLGGDHLKAAALEAAVTATLAGSIPG